MISLINPNQIGYIQQISHSWRNLARREHLCVVSFFQWIRCIPLFLPWSQTLCTPLPRTSYSYHVLLFLLDPMFIHYPSLLVSGQESHLMSGLVMEGGKPHKSSHTVQAFGSDIANYVSSCSELRCMVQRSLCCKYLQLPNKKKSANKRKKGTSQVSHKEMSTHNFFCQYVLLNRIHCFSNTSYF